MSAGAARTQRLLAGPILPTLLKLAAPNLVLMLVQSSLGLIEAYWVGQLGTDALAGVALVFPALMLMQMMSAGAMGGGISSAIARAIGAKKRNIGQLLDRGVIMRESKGAPDFQAMIPVPPLIRVWLSSTIQRCCSMGSVWSKVRMRGMMASTVSRSCRANRRTMIPWYSSGG
mgnify:CR=1 FL=1